MTTAELKRRIRNSEPTPGVPETVFQTALQEVIEEDHPGWRTMTLMESKQPSGHERMRIMLESTDRSTPVSDLKDAPRSGDSGFAPNFDAALAAAKARQGSGPSICSYP